MVTWLLHLARYVPSSAGCLQGSPKQSNNVHMTEGITVWQFIKQNTLPRIVKQKDHTEYLQVVFANHNILRFWCRLQ